MTYRLPYFPFYVDDFLSDDAVDAMSPAELGGYVRLLLMAWKRPEAGVLPDDPKRLAKWSRLGRNWTKCAANIMRAFEQRSDGQWSQKRMTQVAREQHARYRISVQAGRKSAETRRAAASTLQGASKVPSGCLQGSYNQSEPDQEQEREEAKTSPTETAFAPSAPAAPPTLALVAPVPAKPPKQQALPNPEQGQAVEVLQAYREAWHQRNGRAPPADKADMSTAKDLVRSHGVDKAREFVAWFLADTDQYLERNGHRLRLISTRLHGYLANGKPRGDPPRVGWAPATAAHATESRDDTDKL